MKKKESNVFEKIDNEMHLISFCFVKMQGKCWIWLGIFGSLLFLIGGFMNVVKVFKMQQIDDLRLEKLRGGAHERLIHEREGQVPLILEDQRRRKRHIAEDPKVVLPLPTPYRDVLIGQTPQNVV